MSHKLLPGLFCAALVAAGLALYLPRDREGLDPDSGFPRLHSAEVHYLIPPDGPWIAGCLDGHPTANYLICTNGTRVPLRRGALFMKTAEDLRRKASVELPDSDFPMYWHGDEAKQEIVRCRDGAVLWSGPGLD